MANPLAVAAHNAFEAAIAAADPAEAVLARLRAEHLVPGTGGRLQILGLGKAAPAMTEAAIGMVPDGTSWSAVAVTVEGAASGREAAEILIGAHPVPDASSAEAGARLLAEAEALGPSDRLLVLISGGGSALAVAPVDGVTLAEKAALNDLLLASGLDIVAMNTIRQRVSRLKGGGLAHAAAPAPVTTLILSDVIGDDVSAIASGPTAARVGKRGDAERLARAAGIWDRLPASVRTAIETETDTAGFEAENLVVGSNGQSVAAAAEALGGQKPRVLPEPLIGDVQDAAEALLREAEAGSFVTGGETTVIVRGSGKGGRNQELALRFALVAEERLQGDWVFLSGGTDGRDGPTDAAGAIVDPRTLEKIRSAGIDPRAALAANDAYPALDAADALIKIPATGTNVADVQVFLRKL